VERVLRTADELERQARAERPPPDLEVVTRAGAVRLRGLEPVLVGRGQRCGVVLGGAGVSRCHAALVRHGAGWWVEDLDSRNGTWCAGERVRSRRIADGDVLELGGEPVRCRLR
jgi:pSer/pThr/pTyr-binding forkhead associated (FHA) protein